jgi:hypothetical protein
MKWKVIKFNGSKPPNSYRSLNIIHQPLPTITNHYWPPLATVNDLLDSPYLHVTCPWSWRSHLSSWMLRIPSPPILVHLGLRMTTNGWKAMCTDGNCFMCGAIQLPKLGVSIYRIIQIHVTTCDWLWRV